MPPFPRLRPLTSAALLGLLASGGALWWALRPSAPMNVVAAASGPSAHGGLRTVHFDASSGGEAPIAASAEPAASSRAPVVELSAEGAAQFAALCQLRLLAVDADLDLSHREWAKLAAAVTHAQGVRLAYEAEIATVTEISSGRFRVEVPAYAAAGDELRRRFEAELREQLGERVAAEVLAKLGPKLEGSFAGFGVSAQSLEITGDPVRAPKDVTVERTARYWNAAEGGERVTTRRETHLPAVEDPSGEAWTPLLALVSKAE